MKYNYFDALEALSLCALETVKLGCSDGEALSAQISSEQRAKFDATLFELEKSLFEEFLPPLRRESIAEYAHSLARLTDAACEHITAKLVIGANMTRQSEEERICLQLAKRIHEGTSMLKALRKSGETPDIKEYRALATQALEAHNKERSTIRRTATGSGREERMLSSGKLRRELSLCFDGLLEIMLNNI